MHSIYKEIVHTIKVLYLETYGTRTTEKIQEMFLEDMLL